MERMPPAPRSRAACTSLVWSWMARSSHAGLSHSIETSAVALRGSRAASWVRMPCVIERDRADPPNHCGFHRSETTAMAPRRITFVVGLAVVEALAFAVRPAVGPTLSPTIKSIQPPLLFEQNTGQFEEQRRLDALDRG